MKATVLDMRRNPKKILDAIARNERVSLSMRGKEIAEIVPKHETDSASSIAEAPAVGMWAGRDDMTDPSAYVRNLRKGRFNAL